MNRVVVNVLAWIGVGVIAGLIYWIGHFHGYSASADFFHEKCKEVYVFKFKGDDTPYLCIPPPPSPQYEHKMEVPTAEALTTELRSSNDHI